MKMVGKSIFKSKFVMMPNESLSVLSHSFSAGFPVECWHLVRMRIRELNANNYSLRRDVVTHLVRKLKSKEEQ